MSIIPYIHFQGHCAEALAFYAAIFGAEDLQLMRYADAPDMPDALQDPTRIIHGQVTLGDGVLMASDYPPGMAGDPQAAVSIMKVAKDEATARHVFAGLSDGAQIIQDYGPTFFSKGFGMLKDRYGTHWMISVAPDQSAA
ncbi:MAG: hypothetical protein RIT14_1357 [Pseudomonadota bacterium]